MKNYEGKQIRYYSTRRFPTEGATYHIRKVIKRGTHIYCSFWNVTYNCEANPNYSLEHILEDIKGGKAEWVHIKPIKRMTKHKMV